MCDHISAVGQDRVVCFIDGCVLSDEVLLIRTPSELPTSLTGLSMNTFCFMTEILSINSGSLRVILVWTGVLFGHILLQSARLEIDENRRLIFKKAFKKMKLTKIKHSHFKMKQRPLLEFVPQVAVLLTLVYFSTVGSKSYEGVC